MKLKRKFIACTADHKLCIESCEKQIKRAEEDIKDLMFICFGDSECFDRETNIAVKYFAEHLLENYMKKLCGVITDRQLKRIELSSGLEEEYFKDDNMLVDWNGYCSSASLAEKMKKYERIEEDYLIGTYGGCTRPHYLCCTSTRYTGRTQGRTSFLT